MSLRRIAPTLAPLPLGALLRGAAALAGARAGASLVAEVAEALGVPEVRGYALGRAALAAALETAMRATGRRGVVLPAFTSFSVAAAAARAGADVMLCDLDPVTLELDRAALRACVGPGTAAVVLGNVFGRPDTTSDLGWIGAAGALLVDDAAQALGAAEGGRPAGSRGALGVLSFGRGKCVSLGDGGALLVNDPALRGHTPAAPAAATRGAVPWLAACVLWACRSQSVFGLVSRSPGAQVGESHYAPEFAMAGPGAAVHAMAVGLGAEIARQRAVRRAVARWWVEGLAGVPGLRVPPEVPGTESAYLRLPVLAESAGHREVLVGRLRAARFSHVRSFPHPLDGIAEFRRFCGASPPVSEAAAIAQRLVALPVHAGVDRGDVGRAVAALAPGPD